MSLLAASPKEVLLSLMNQQNTSLPVPLTDENLYFGNPHLDTDGLTSILPTTAMLGEDYEGYANFKYKRIDLGKAFGDLLPALSSTGGPSLYSMLPIINQYFGLNLTEADVLDASVAFITGGSQVNINVVAQPTSLGYTGSFMFRFFRLLTQFQKAVAKTELGVLSYPISPSLAKNSIAMMMWNHDFTLDLPTLKVVNHYWANVPGVQALMQDFGILDWPAPQVQGVSDYATSDYPGANTNFARVTVQKGVVGSTYTGDALFHYNLT